ncbi:MAG: MarR family transcriptional regulator [Nitrososphaerota archaeon]|jgi:DNA-binding MarR family transcriptional regulator|nr:MarR family transcriptional regulator [Nitrososphaerota archaeon]MDG6927285.1 MarR family transcriptional regulator [Nitrososphaerota archaeon]MDG6930357.1 MarR family transcriptional regulator [Nitrososphaerota archaeon]MDG6931713.1 MarR family transcriptional regulator [Nitrososphaerota archaeon]MDG6936761.1 MarR family transcriptional regulator [Nitrososphaerota archaeon]
MANYNHLNEEIMEAVFTASRTFRTWMRECSGLSVAQFRVLSFISRNNNCSLLELKNYLGISTPSTSRLVEALNMRGFVTRVEDGNDRRRVKLGLTKMGNEVLITARKRVLERIEERIGGLSLDEKRNLSMATEILREMADKNDRNC